METQLLITRKTNGQITVEGPVNDKLLCYGMLEAAKDAVREFIAHQTATGLVVPQGPLPTNGA